MGSYFEIRLGASTPGAIGLTEGVLDLIDALEQQMTVYRDDSEVSQINAMAYPGPVEIEPGLFRLLEQCLAGDRPGDGRSVRRDCGGVVPRLADLQRSLEAGTDRVQSLPARGVPWRSTGSPRRSSR